MSNGLTAQNERPAKIIPTVPTRRSILHAASAPSRPFAGWRGQAQTEVLPAVTAARRRRLDHRPSPAPSPAPSRVSTSAKPTGSRDDRAGRRSPARRADRHHHLRPALAGIALAAALLAGLQLLALDGIASARRAALQSAQSPMSGQAASMSDRTLDARSDVRTDISPDWVTQDTGAPYDRTNPQASPLDLPRCTTSPDTPLPCLATLSPDSRRAVVLEEDASLTALVRR